VRRLVALFGLVPGIERVVLGGFVGMPSDFGMVRSPGEGVSEVEARYQDWLLHLGQ
jgi:hypothetical protein